MNFLKAPTLALLPLALLTACGGGGGGGGNSAPAAPAITSIPAPVAFTASVSPADGAADVARTAAVEATFSVAPQTASIDSKSAQLIGPEGNVIGLTSTLAANKVSFKPEAGALPGSTKFSFKLTADVKNAAATSLTVPTPVSFTTAAQQWDAAATPVDALPDYNTWAGPWLVNDAAGAVTSIWQRIDDNVAKIYASRRAAGSDAWSTPVLVYTAASAQPVSFASLVADGRGDVFIAWDTASSIAIDANHTSMFARFDAASGQWTPATAFTSTLDIPLGTPQLAVDASGTVTAVTLGLLKQSISATRFDRASNTWSAPVTIAKVTDASLDLPRIAVDGKGNLVAAWSQNLAAGGLQLSRYDATTAQWSAPVVVDSTARYGNFTVAGHEAGGFTLAWNAASASTTNANTIVHTLTAVRMAPGENTWSAKQVISATDEIVGLLPPRLVVSPAGVATVVYITTTGLKASRSAAGASTWSATAEVVKATDGVITYPETVAVDGAGNVSLLYTTNGVLGASVYSPGSSQWSTSAIGAGLTRFVLRGSAKHVAQRNGDITAVWADAPTNGIQQNGAVLGAALASRRLR